MSAVIPVITLYESLVVPIQGTVDDRMMSALQANVMERIESGNPKGLIIDVSGIALLDSYMTRNIRDLALIARLMGLRSVVSGLRPELAITLIEMGLEIQGVETALTVERALDMLLSADDAAAQEKDHARA